MKNKKEEKIKDEFNEKVGNLLLKAMNPKLVSPFEDTPEKQMTKLCKNPKYLPNRKKLN